jgi:hypothetical protein
MQLTIKSYTEGSTTHIDTTTVVAGLDKTQENRTMDWVDADHMDKIFGKCRQKNRLVGPADYKMVGPGTEDDVAFLKAEKLKDGSMDSKREDGQIVQNHVLSVGGAGWQCEQVWGFEVVGGERRYARRVVVWNGPKSVRTRIVYDYKGEGQK